MHKTNAKSHGVVNLESFLDLSRLLHTYIN